MAYQDGIVKERVKFLSQDADRLRSMRGRELYETLGQLGLSYGQFYRALGTNVQDYCAQEFGVDMNKITVERFFQSDPNAKWLFPDIVREGVVSGMKRKPVYPSLIARDERVEGAVYDIPYVNESSREEELRSLAEGAAIPESEISYGDRVVRLAKYGRGVIASYEAIRRMSMDVLRIHLQRIGELLGRRLDGGVAYVLVNGDDSGAPSQPVTLNTATRNTWTYGDLVSGFMQLTVAHSFTPTHVLASAELCKTLLGLAEFKEAGLFDFAKTGNLPTPLGMRLVPMEGQPEGKLTILDAGYALVKLTEQDLLVESDKLINQQWDRTYVTTVTALAILYPKARVVVQSDWE
jgi:hypothetical protein